MRFVPMQFGGDDRDQAAGGCFFSQSCRATSTRVCQPSPVARNLKNIEFRPRERTSYRLLCDPLTKNLLSSLGWRDAPPELLAAAYRNGDAQEPVRELVVLQRVLADEVNRGYDNLEPEIVKTIDGVRPRDLARALELAEGGAAPAGEHSEDLLGSYRPVG